MFVAQTARGLQVFLGGRQDAAFALNRLDNHGAGFVADGCFQCGNIIEGNVGNAGRQRRVVFAVFGLAADGYGKQGTAVEAVEAGDDFGFVFSKMIATVFARQFQRGFIGFCAGVAEKHFVGEGVFDQFFGQLLRRLGGIDIRNVPEFLRLFGQGCDQIGMAMAQRIHSNTA